MLLLLWAAACAPTDTEPPPADTAPAPVADGSDTPPAAPAPTGAEAVPPTPVLFNELQAANDSTAMEADGTFPDWLELFNRSADPVPLSRLVIRHEGVSHPLAPLDTTPGAAIPPGGHLRIVVDADGGAGRLGFRLDRDGGSVELLLDDAVADALTWAALPPDAAVARIPDGRDWYVTARPTPAYTNGSRPTDSPDPTDLLFSLAGVPEVRVWLPAASRQALDAAPYEEVPGALAIGGAFYPAVGVKLKGRLGSFRTLDGKAGLRVDLNAYADHRYRGLKSLTFNNMVQDPSYTHEHLTYTLYRELGVPAPRTGYAVVFVDDERFGLYLDIETPDDVFLERWFADPDGPMWEGSYGADFDGNVGAFEYDEGPPVEDRAPLEELQAFLDANPAGGPAALAEVQTLVDMDRFLTMMAVEAAALHWDGYTTRNNYHVYHDPSTDLLTFLPWGTDQTWVDWWYGWYDAQGRLFQWCMAQPDCVDVYNQKLRLTARTIRDLDLVGQLDALHAWLNPWVRLDTRAERPGERQGYVDATRRTLIDHPREILQGVPP